MKRKENFISGSKGSHLHIISWHPDSEPTAVVQILHGMAEFGERYEDFAKYLTKNGYAVYTHDHRKHGKSINEDEIVGIFDKNDGWENVIDDVQVVNDFIKVNEKNKNIIILGHSMGSIICRRYIQVYGQNVVGAILSGTAPNQPFSCTVGKVIGSIVSKINNKNSRSVFMDNLTVGAFNKPFKPERTSCDWLSTDKEQVDWYVADELCGLPYSAEFYVQFYKGILTCNKLSNIVKTPHFPILFISGDQDPVGHMGKGVKKVYDIYASKGYKDNITMKLVSGARHEILNEINKTEIYEYILDWIRNNQKRD